MTFAGGSLIVAMFSHSYENRCSLVLKAQKACWYVATRLRQKAVVTFPFEVSIMINTSRRQGYIGVLVLILAAVFTIAALFIARGFHSFKAFDVGQEAGKTIDKQNSKDKKSFFLSAVYHTLNEVNILELKEATIPEDAKEIRIWWGFGVMGTKGLIFRDDKTNWSAVYIPDVRNATSPSNTPRSLPEPKSGWQELSMKLQELEIYNLPGEPDEVPGRETLLDMSTVIVEIKTSSSYRVYKYDSPYFFQTEETEKIKIILKTLSSEFNIDLWLE
jgi:hypothetical protein